MKKIHSAHDMEQLLHEDALAVDAAARWCWYHPVRREILIDGGGGRWCWTSVVGHGDGRHLR